MCGICGVWGVADAHERVGRMLARMVHRGPDGNGRWGERDFALGHARLAIVDLSDNGRQPMVLGGAEDQLVAVVNGEIYNYPDLRRELEAAGARFSSTSDSEVVLHAYRAWGSDAFARLNGMFAFALWDRAREKLFLVRDRLGIKPIYYLHENGLFSFASEIKALLPATDARRWAIDGAGLGQYLGFQNMLGSQSLFSGVAMLSPGHVLEVSRNGLTCWAFWSPTIAPTPIGFDEAVDGFRRLFEASVRRHLMSDVPVATYLSAGFDSTMVASTAARNLSTPPNAFTGHFDAGGWYNELSGATLVAGRMGSRLEGVSIGADDFVRHFNDIIYALDEPRMGMGAFPQYMVASRAAENNRVILTGHGGDELFSGYPVFKMALFDHAWRNDKGQLASLMGGLRPAEIPHLGYFLLQRFSQAGEQRFLPQLFSPAELAKALRPDIWERVAPHMAYPEFEGLVGKCASPYERILKTYLRVYLPGLLAVEDKISMAHSLESRTPFLDNEMVEFSLRIPQTIKLHGGRLKAIIKAAAEGVLPPELFSMPKRGFPTPLRYWLRGPLAGWLQERLCASDTPLLRLFNRPYLEHFVASYLASPRRYLRPLDEIATHRMWVMLSLDAWMRQFEVRNDVVLE